MTEQDIISMYNHHLEQSNQSDSVENFELFMQGLLIDNIITLQQYNNMMEV